MAGSVVISKSFVDATNEPGDYRDSKLPGFILRVGKQSKSYIVNSKMKGTKKQVSVSLDRHGVITAKQARDRAAEALSLIKQGVNPNDLRREEAHHRNSLEELTLGKVFDQYLASKQLKSETRYIYRCVVESRFSDWLKTPITEIDDLMVESRHKEISKTYRADANHAMRILRAVFNYASHTYLDKSKRPIIDRNPVKRLSNLKLWNKIDRRKDYLKAHQIKPWLEAVRTLSNPVISDYLQLILMTGLRMSEGMKLKWEQVDMKAKTFYIDDTKNHQRHELPMTPFLFELFSRRLSMRESEYVFPGQRKGTHLKDVRFQVEEVEAASGVEFRLHDLRRTFATVAESLDLSSYAIKRLVNHKTDGDVTAGYIVSDVERLRVALEKINSRILELAGES